MSTRVTWENIAGVAVVTLDGPQRRNALGLASARELTSVVEALKADSSVAAVVVRGLGVAFCAGADLSEIKAMRLPTEFESLIREMAEAFSALADLRPPTIAAVHGAAVGGGLELAISCDLMIVEEGSRLALPEVLLGLLPAAGGTQRLPRLMPRAVAKEMILTGEGLAPERAYQLGLVNRIVPPGTAFDEAMTLARLLADQRPRAAVGEATRLVDEGLKLPLEAGIELERHVATRLFTGGISH
jgi:enoyl-CoA hydratase